MAIKKDKEELGKIKREPKLDVEKVKRAEEMPEVFKKPPEFEKEIPKKEERKLPEKEKIKEVEKIVEKTEEPGKAPPPAQKISPIMQDEELLADLKDILALNKPKQIKILVYLAFKKGIHHATYIAKQLKDPYLMDEFHDTLVDELYDLLIKRKKIKSK